MRNLSRKSLRRLIRICAQTDISVKANQDNGNIRVKYLALIRRTPGYKNYVFLGCGKGSGRCLLAYPSNFPKLARKQLNFFEG